MKQEVKIDQTDYTVLVLIRSATTGAPVTGLLFNSAGGNGAYTRVETNNDVHIVEHAGFHDLATPALEDPHLDWGFLEVDATHAPGLYRLDIPDAAFATGAWSSVVTVLFTDADPVHMEFILVPEAPVDGVKINSIADAKITAASIADGAIDNATFAADVGSTAYATNIIALAADKAIVNAKLDHLVAVADSDDVADNSIIGKLASTDGDWSKFSDTTDALQSIRDKLPANLEDMSIVDTTGLVDITQTAADKVWGTAARVLTANTNLAGVEVDLTKIHGTALTETAGQLAAAFIKFFDVATPMLTCESVNQEQDNATTAEIKTAMEAAGGYLALIKTAAEAVDTLTKAAGAGDLAAVKTAVDLIEDITRNKMTVTDANGNVVLYADDNTTPLYSVAACVTDDATTTTRKRLA